MTDQSADERYPEMSEDAGPLDPIVQVLAEAEAPHEEKAIACLLAARREYQFAVEDGEIEAVANESANSITVSGFLEWGRKILSSFDEIVDRVP